MKTVNDDKAALAAAEATRITALAEACTAVDIAAAAYESACDAARDSLAAAIQAAEAAYANAVRATAAAIADTCPAKWPEAQPPPTEEPLMDDENKKFHGLISKGEWVAAAAIVRQYTRYPNAGKRGQHADALAEWISESEFYDDETVQQVAKEWDRG